MEERKFYVYRHIRLDNLRTFYVGKGFGHRAYRKSRNKYWKHIARKCGYVVRIMFSGLTEVEALAKEIHWIAFFKKRRKARLNLDGWRCAPRRDRNVS